MDNQQESSQFLDLIEIPELLGYYADKYGNIYSTKRSALPKLLKQCNHYGKSAQPYKRLKIAGKAQLSHRVLASIIKKRPLTVDEMVNHLDGNGQNNNLDNLEIVSHKQNVQHAVDNGLYCSGKRWYLARGLEIPRNR